MGKLKNIEFLRFVFMLVLVLCHFKHGVINVFGKQIELYSKMLENIVWSNSAVEFFFILAGFFMFLTITKNMDTINFALKRLIRFMPSVIFVVLLVIVSKNFTLAIKYNPYETIFTLLNIQNIGWTLHTGPIPASWFVSALFWTQLFYFYLYKSIDKRIFNIIVACFVVLGYTIYVHAGITNLKTIYNVINLGMVRALAGVGVGYFLSMWFLRYGDEIKKIRFNIFQTILCSAMEVYLLAFTINAMCFHKINFDNRMILVVSFVGLIILFVSKKGYLSKILENNISVFLGKFALSMFLIHQFILKFWAYYVCKLNSSWVIKHPLLNIYLLFILVILCSVALYYFVEKPALKWYKNLQSKNPPTPLGGGFSRLAMAI